jgi:hypothetical protein
MRYPERTGVTPHPSRIPWPMLTSMNTVLPLGPAFHGASGERGPTAARRGHT